MRVLCVLIPHFPLSCEVQRNPDIKEHPIIIIHAAGSQKLVFDHSPELDGLQRDMTLQQALSRHGQVDILQADIPYYRAIFNEILDAMEEKSPLVEGPELGCVYIDVDGLQLIYPDDDVLLKAIRNAIPEAFKSRIGIAGNKFLAYLATRCGPPGGHRILNGDVAALLRRLPCDVLPVSMKSLSRLHDFGINTLGQVATLFPGPLQAQFGPEGKRIWELAHGIDNTPLHPRFMEKAIEESTILSSVTVSLEAMLVASESLLMRVFKDISYKGLGIRSLTLWTRTWNAGNWERTIQFKEPALEVKSTISRIKRVLEDYPQPGPVEQVGMRINRLGYPRGQQKSLFSDLRAKEHLNDDIKQLELRLGKPQVYRLKEVEPWSRIPERRYALTPSGR